MQLSLDPNKGHYSITAYLPGKITIHDNAFTDSLIITPSEIIHPWRPQAMAEIQLSDLALLADQQPDIVLLGSGSTHHFPSLDILDFFHTKHIGVEVMNTSAACRTFNVLVAEGRKVIAGLFLE